VTIRVKTRDGRTLTGRLRYRVCAQQGPAHGAPGGGQGGAGVGVVGGGGEA